MSRRDAREKAMQLLYQLDSQIGDDELQITNFLRERTPLAILDGPEESPEDADEAGKAGRREMSESDRAYLQELVRGVKGVEKELDELYGPYLVKWTPERLPRLERVLLRLGTYEIVRNEDVPDSVAINEVVRLTRKYADDEAYSYINAVLGKVSRAIAQPAAPTAENLSEDGISADCSPDAAELAAESQPAAEPDSEFQTELEQESEVELLNGE